MHLYVDDVDASWERALEAGALEHTPLHDAYWGDRTGILIDANGHLWSIATKIENVSQDEIQRRAHAWQQPVAEIEADAEVAVELLVQEEVLAEPTVAA